MDKIEVTQADRLLVADMLDEVSNLLDHNGIGQVADLIRDGEYDEHDCVKIAARHRLATRTDATPVATDVAALVDHFRRMIEACANYVEPTTYIARHPIGEQCKWDTEFPEPDTHQSVVAAQARTHHRNQAFISDMIYMLDGPEQRQALAPFTKGQP